MINPLNVVVEWVVNVCVVIVIFFISPEGVVNTPAIQNRTSIEMGHSAPIQNSRGFQPNSHILLTRKESSLHNGYWFVVFYCLYFGTTVNKSKLCP
jgi:hypothetical protein